MPLCRCTASHYKHIGLSPCRQHKQGRTKSAGQQSKQGSLRATFPSSRRRRRLALSSRSRDTRAESGLPLLLLVFLFSRSHSAYFGASSLNDDRFGGRQPEQHAMTGSSAADGGFYHSWVTILTQIGIRTARGCVRELPWATCHRKTVS